MADCFNIQTVILPGRRINIADVKRIFSERVWRAKCVGTYQREPIIISRSQQQRLRATDLARMTGMDNHKIIRLNNNTHAHMCQRLNVVLVRTIFGMTRTNISTAGTVSLRPTIVCKLVAERFVYTMLIKHLLRCADRRTHTQKPTCAHPLSRHSHIPIRTHTHIHRRKTFYKSIDSMHSIRAHSVFIWLLRRSLTR